MTLEMWISNGYWWNQKCPNTHMHNTHISTNNVRSLFSYIYFYSRTTTNERLLELIFISAKISMWIRFFLSFSRPPHHFLFKAHIYSFFFFNFLIIGLNITIMLAQHMNKYVCVYVWIHGNSIDRRQCTHATSQHISFARASCHPKNSAFFSLLHIHVCMHALQRTKCIFLLGLVMSANLTTPRKLKWISIHLPPAIFHQFKHIKTRGG